MKILGLDAVIVGTIAATCFLTVFVTFGLPLPLQVGITVVAVLITVAVAQNYVKRRDS